MANDRERDTKRTTIITSDGDGRGSAGIILVLALIIIILAVLIFSGAFSRGDDHDLNVAVNAPDVNVIVPQTQVPVVTVPETQVVPPPDVNVNVATPPTEPREENLGNTENTLANRD